MRGKGLALAAAVTATAARADVVARCTGTLAEDRVLATVEVSGLFEDDMLRLMRLGLVGRVRIEASLVRKRRFWVEHRMSAGPIETAVTYSKPSGKFLLDGRREIRVDEPLSFGRLSLRFQDEIPKGSAHSLEVQVRLQVVTASSLSGVRKWIGGGGRDQDEEDSAISRWVVSAVVNDLTRNVTATCPLQAAAASPP